MTLFGRRKKADQQTPTPNPAQGISEAHMEYIQKNLEFMKANGLQGIPIRGRLGHKDTDFVSRSNCPACGEAIPFRAKFCQSCGKAIPPVSSSDIPKP